MESRSGGVAIERERQSILLRRLPPFSKLSSRGGGGEGEEALHPRSIVRRPTVRKEALVKSTIVAGI